MICRLSNQLAQDTATYDREEKKLQTYTEISSSLSRINATAASAVAPTMADILLKHAQYKQRIDDDCRALGNVWEQVIESFMTEIIHIVEAKIEDALLPLRNGAVQAARHIIGVSNGDLKRTLGENALASLAEEFETADKENKDRRSEHERDPSRDHKRRRVGASNPSTPAQQGVRSRTESSGDQNSNIGDILSQMKLKIDQQAQSLQTLAKENNEVRSHCTPHSKD